MAPESPALVALQAAAYASSKHVPLVLTASSTSATTALAALGDLGAESVWLFGAQASFSPAFESAISSDVTLLGEIIDDSALMRAIDAIGAATPDTLNIVRSDRPFDIALAGAESARTGHPLIALDGTEDTQDLAEFLADHQSARLVVFGDGTTLPPGAVDEEQLGFFDTLDTTDRVEASLRLANRATFEGARGNYIVVAPSDQPVAVGLAGLIAGGHGGVVAIAGTSAALVTASPALSLLDLWKAETDEVTLVGTDLDSADLTAVAAPTLVPRSASPAFRVTNLVSASGSYTVTLSAAAGATSYSAYDGEGQLAATSPTPQLTIAGTPGILAVFADGPSGPLGRLELRANDYLASAGREDAVVASVDGTSAHLLFLGSNETPRVITRAETNPFADVPITSDADVIAITCDSTYTDTGLTRPSNGTTPCRR